MAAARHVDLKKKKIKYTVYEMCPSDEKTQGFFFPLKKKFCERN